MSKKCIAFFLIFLAPFCYAQHLGESLDSLMGLLISEGKLHGSVCYVQQNNQVLHNTPYGYQYLEQGKVMQTNTLFRVASMTKILTAAGALKLCEKGLLQLDAPLKNFMPEFSNMQVMENLNTDSMKLVPAQRDITIRDLFCHTAGFGCQYEAHPGNDTIDQLYIAAHLSDRTQSSGEFIAKLAKMPLKFHPGTGWEYSYSIDVLGFLIEQLTGQNLHEYLTRELFVPLEMFHTGFYVPAEYTDQFSANYEYRNGKLQLLDAPETSDYLTPPVVYSGGGGFENNEGGVVSTAEDFANFCTMLLNKGCYNGIQILQPQTIAVMASDQIAHISNRQFAVEGYGLGLGVINLGKSPDDKMVYWAGGPYNTYFFIDFSKELIAIFLTQNGPWWHEALIDKFRTVVMRNIP